MAQALFAVITFLLIFVIFIAIIKAAWSYLVIRLFPGAVEQNLIVREISWKIAAILAFVLALISN